MIKFVRGNIGNIFCNFLKILGLIKVTNLTLLSTMKFYVTVTCYRLLLLNKHTFINRILILAHRIKFHFLKLFLIFCDFLQSLEYFSNILLS